MAYIVLTKEETEGTQLVGEMFASDDQTDQKQPQAYVVVNEASDGYIKVEIERVGRTGARQKWGWLEVCFVNYL